MGQYVGIGAHLEARSHLGRVANLAERALIPTGNFLVGTTIEVADDGDGSPALYILVSSAPTLWAEYADPGAGGAAPSLSDLRPYRHPTTTVSPINVATTGNDVTGNGSGVTPYATILRAIQDIGIVVGAEVVILCGAGTFALPQTIALANFIAIEGNVSTAATMTVASVTTATDLGGLVVNVTGLAVGADALRGQLTQWTTGPATGRRGWVYRSDATGAYVVGETRLYMTQELDTLLVPVVGNTLIQEALNTTLDYGAVAQASVVTSQAFRVRRCRLTGATALVFHNTTNEGRYLHCRDEVLQRIADAHGRVIYECSYVATQADALHGLFSVRNGGIGEAIRGTVFDGGINAAGGERFVDVEHDGQVVFRQWVVCRQLEYPGWNLDGAQVFVQDGVSAHDTLRFEVDAAGVGSCTGGVTINATLEGQGGQYQLPNLVGRVEAAFAVEAEDCSCVVLGPSSSLANNTGVLNRVSADSGVTEVSQATDTTQVRSGNIPADGFRLDADTLTVGAAPLVAGNLLALSATGQLVLADSLTVNDLFRVVGVAPRASAAAVRAAAYTPGKRVPVLFGAAPAAANNGDDVFLDTTTGQGTLTAPAAAGRTVYAVGVLQGANGVTTTPDVVFLPEFRVHVT